jgi:hypothetical protein
MIRRAIPLLLLVTVHGFSVHRSPAIPRATSLAPPSLQPTTVVLSAAAGDEEDRLSSLGYSEQEIQRSRTSTTGDNRKAEDIKVNVNLLPEVDAVTLTAVGFGLIAANFFIFANMGDGGIAGVVASIINLSRQ